jgi:hypothetical protein
MVDDKWDLELVIDLLYCYPFSVIVVQIIWLELLIFFFFVFCMVEYGLVVCLMNPILHRYELQIYLHIYCQAAVLAMDESVLDVDQVENLIKFCPTKEEMELLKVMISHKLWFPFIFLAIVESFSHWRDFVLCLCSLEYIVSHQFYLFIYFLIHPSVCLIFIFSVSLFI